MVDSYGPVPIPMAAPPAGGSAGDPAIDTILSFLKAFLVSDQNATGAWQVAGVSPANPPVVGTFPHDPEEDVFNARDLPALYLWRESATNEWLADDYLVESSLLKLVWVMPRATPENQSVRSPFVNGLVKAIQVAIERGRTPGWVQSGDTDPNAAAQGSDLGAYLGGWSLRVDRWRRTHVVERARDGVVKAIYAAVELQLTLQESWSVDITDPSRFPPTSQGDGVDATLTINGGTSTVEGHLAGTPVRDAGSP